MFVFRGGGEHISPREWRWKLRGWLNSVNWSGALDYWSGLLEWTTGVDNWNGLLEYGLDYTSGICGQARSQPCTEGGSVLSGSMTYSGCTATKKTREMPTKKFWPLFSVIGMSSHGNFMLAEEAATSSLFRRT